MNLSALAVKRPIATATILLIVLVIGLVSLYQSPLDLLPEIQAPVLAVITVFPGSSPQETLELVTKPIEDSVSAVSGLTALNSFSRENLSLVILRFNWGADIKKVREDVNVRMDLISFPDGVQRPLLFEFDPTLLPMMQVSASGADDPIVLTNWLEEKALPRLESLSGVASVQIQGGAREDLFIRITPEVMAEYEISFEQIANVLRASLIDLPAGIIELDDRQVRVRFLGRYADSDLLSDLIVGFSIDQDQLAKLIGQEVDINLNQFLSGQNGGLTSGSRIASRPVPVSELYWDDLFNFDQAIFTGGNLFLPLNADWVAQSDGDMASSLRLFTVNPVVSYDQGLQSLVMSIETFGQIPLLDESGRTEIFGNNNVVRLSDIWLINQAELDNGYLIIPLDQSRLHQNEVTFEQIRLLAANHPLIVESSPEQIKIAYHQDWERIRREPIVAVPDYRAWLDGVQSDVQQGIGDTSRLLEESLTEIATTMIISSMMPGNSSFGAISFDEDFPIEPISLGSLAEIKQDTYNPTTISRYNRLPSIGLVMQKEGDANTVVVARQLRAELQKLSEESENAEFQVQFNTVFDQAAEIESALADLAWSLVGGAILAVLVLIFFLRNWRTTLFIAISIPAAIITTFTLLYFTDLTINLMTLGGLALAAGMLVDNAIVVSENIYRHYQMGKEPAAAAVEGADEVAGAVTASTLTTLSVFFPVVFLSGLAGQLFWEFALTVACAILASLMVALTVIPLMASRSLSRGSKLKNDVQVFEKEPTYHRLLGLAVRYPWWVLLFALFFVLVGVFAYGTLGSELFPSPDESAYRIDITLPPGVIMQATDDYVAEVEAILSARPEVLAFSARIGGGGFIGALGEGGLASEAQIRVDIKPEFVGEINLLMDEVRKELESLPVEAEVTFTRESLLAAAGLETGLDLVMSGSDLTEVVRLTEQAVTMLKQHPLFTDIQSSFEESRPEVHIRLDHGQALQKGVTLIQVATAVRQALEGIPVSRIETDSGVLNIVLGYQQRDISSIEDLGNIGFYSPAGEYLQLNQVAELSEAYGPQSIPRENQQIVGQIQIQYSDLDLGTATEVALEILEDLSLPAGYEVRTAGSSNLMGDVMSELQLVLIVAAILVYLVMAAQFESLLHPFIIICSLPLAYAGSVLALIITGNEVSIPAMIGVVVLSGILVNDGIIMVDFINQQRRIHGLPLVEAIVEGAAARLRPILMTTATTVLGLVPLAMGLGEGGQLQAPMAITIIGGQITGTLLLLLAIPSIYKLVNREKNTSLHHSARSNNKGWHTRLNGAGNGRDRQFIKLVLRMIVTLVVAALIFYLIKVYW